MKNSIHKVSVIIPCFNSERYISESIDSVLNQDYIDYEIIVVDDGSTDKTKDIVNSYSLKHNNIRYFYKKHSGIPDSLNFGIDKSLGEYIMRLDSDDISLSGRMRLQASLLDRNSDTVLIGGGYLSFNEDEQNERVFFCRNNKNIIRNIERGLRWFPHSSAFFRKNVFRQIGGYDTSFNYSQDLDLWLRLSRYGNVACIHKPIVKIRSHVNQISEGKYESSSQKLFAQLAIIRHLLVLNGYEDPFLGKNSNEFIDFVKNSDLYIKYNNRRSKWVYKNKKIKKYNPSQVFKLFVGYGSFLQFFVSVKERFLGSSISYRLMKDWTSKKIFY